jgi:aryl-alcohol dehydrogenase-like predicted oxidoreductase
VRSDARPLTPPRKAVCSDQASVQRRVLGASDLSITPIGLGTWAIGGGDWIFGWGPQNDSESIAAIRRAIESGVNWIDTAAVYGLGHAELVIARALRDLRRTERPNIFTKCSLVWDELGNVSQDFRPASIRREAEASLRRLEIECFDLYQLGWPVAPNDPGIPVPDGLEDAWETMAALQREGKARFIGVSNWDVDVLDRLHRIAPVASVQVCYSLLQREIEDGMVPFCAARQIGVLVHGALQSGVLTGKVTADWIRALPHNDWRHRNASFQEPTLAHRLGAVERLRAVAARRTRTPGQVAVAWTLRNPTVTAASVGVRNMRQVDELIASASCRLRDEDLDELEGASAEAFRLPHQHR